MLSRVLLIIAAALAFAVVAVHGVTGYRATRIVVGEFAETTQDADTIVAGDYYDVLDAGPGLVVVCLADVSGKGMTAALTMSNVQAIVRTVAKDRQRAPDRALATLNHLLCERLRSGFFVTVFYAVIDTIGGTMSFASAGHPPAFLRRSDGSIERLTSTGLVAGLLPGAEYRCVDIDMRAGDRLVVYSDGVTEYENRTGEQFGEERLLEVLADAPATSAEETCAAIVDALETYGDGRPFDSRRASRPSTIAVGRDARSPHGIQKSRG